MFWVDRIHRWTGAFIGLLLAALGLSGTLLLYKDAWLRATIPQAAEPLVDSTEAVIAATERLMTDASPPSSMILPTDSLRLFRLSYEGGGGAYADQAGTIVARWASSWDRPELWLFDFHHDLLMGEIGEIAGGILAMIGLGFVITGFVLWWRSRKAFAFRLWPERLSRIFIMRHHRDLGVVMGPMLVLTLLTGAMLTLRPVADFVLAPLSPPGTVAESLAPPAIKGGPMSAQFDWRTTLHTAIGTYSGAKLRTISTPAVDGQLVRIRVRQPAEWLPNGRTIFWFDPANGRLVEARDAHALPLAARAFNLVYPLHASTVGGIVYMVAMTAAGLALTLLGTLAVFGFWSFQARRAAQVSRVAPQRP